MMMRWRREDEMGYAIARSQDYRVACTWTALVSFIQRDNAWAKGIVSSLICVQPQATNKVSINRIRQIPSQFLPLKTCNITRRRGKNINKLSNRYCNFPIEEFGRELGFFSSCRRPEGRDRGYPTLPTCGLTPGVVFQRPTTFEVYFRPFVEAIPITRYQSGLTARPGEHMKLCLRSLFFPHHRLALAQCLFLFSSLLTEAPGHLNLMEIIYRQGMDVYTRLPAG